jgi:ankyrin repeat protein
MLYSNLNVDINVVNTTGKSPLIFAIQSKNLDVVRLLILQNANLNQKDKMKRSIYDWAKGNDEMSECISNAINDRDTCILK